MSVKELKSQSADELKKEMRELLEKQFKLRLQKGAGQVARSHEFKVVRRNIARIKTVLHQRANKA